MVEEEGLLTVAGLVAPFFFVACPYFHRTSELHISVYCCDLMVTLSNLTIQPTTTKNNFIYIFSDNRITP